jgi:hypothetical protein
MCTLMTELPRTLFKMRYVSGKSSRVHQNTHFMFNNFYFRKSCRLWDNVEKHRRAGHATDAYMTHALTCWITKAAHTHAHTHTHTHTKYAILIAFPRQQWLRERVSMWCNTYTARLASDSGTLRSNGYSSDFVIRRARVQILAQIPRCRPDECFVSTVSHLWQIPWLCFK